MGALEGLDVMLNDALYGILFRDINMQRTLIDQYMSRIINGFAGVIINTGEDNYLTTADAVEQAHTVLASDLINEQLALFAGLPEEQMGLGHAFEMDPELENGFLFELAQAEFIADGKGDKAHRHIGDHAQRLDLVVACKAEARNAEPAQHERPDQNARHKKRRDIRQMPAAKNTGHQKPCKQRNGQIQNRSHGYTFTTEKVRANRAAQGSYCSLFVRKKQALFCKFPVKVRKNGSFLGKSCHFVSFHTIQSVFARTPAK